MLRTRVLAAAAGPPAQRTYDDAPLAWTHLVFSRVHLQCCRARAHPRQLPLVLLCLTRGRAQRLEHEGNYIYIICRHNGLAGVCICDQEYPQRVAFAVTTKLLDDFQEQVRVPVDATGSWVVAARALCGLVCRMRGLARSTRWRARSKRSA